MRKSIYTVLTAILLIGFIAAGTINIRDTNQKLQLNDIELKSKETQLIELNQRYDEVIHLKTKTDKEKQEQLEKIKQLETDRERLERELQAKLDKQSSDKEKLARSAENASGLKRASAAPAKVTGNKQSWLKASGIPESQWQYVDYIVSKESSWNPSAVNKSSGACGLGQQLPCGKWAGAWNDPVAALKAQYGYVKGRYGGYAQAYSFWQKNSWY